MSEASQWTELLLRKQQMDADAQARQDAAARENLEKLGQAGSRLAAGINQGMERRRKDELANQAMNTMDPPVATAVDPQVQKAAMAQRQAMGWSGPSKPATGGVTEQEFRMAMDNWKQQRMAAQLRRELAQEEAEARRRQGMGSPQLQPGFWPFGQGSAPAQSAPQPRLGPGPAVITVPPQQKTSYAPGMIIRNPDTGERFQWGGSEWMPA